MPHNEPASTDPLTLHGVVVETDSAKATRDMAACFIEEYLRMGFDRGRLWSMFKDSQYVGPFMAYEALGEQVIGQLIDEQIRLRGPRQSQGTSQSPTRGDISLLIQDS